MDRISRRFSSFLLFASFVLLLTGLSAPAGADSDSGQWPPDDPAFYVNAEFNIGALAGLMGGARLFPIHIGGVGASFSYYHHIENDNKGYILTPFAFWWWRIDIPYLNEIMGSHPFSFRLKGGADIDFPLEGAMTMTPYAAPEICLRWQILYIGASMPIYIKSSISYTVSIGVGLSLPLGPDLAAPPAARSPRKAAEVRRLDVPAIVRLANQAAAREDWEYVRLLTREGLKKAPENRDLRILNDLAKNH